MIEIKDNGEKLVDILKECPGIICDLKCAKTYQRKCLVRESVAKMLNKAKSYLPKGVTFIIGDAWRSQKMQKKVFMNRYRRMMRQNPGWSHQRVLKKTKEFVAPYRGKNVSGHMFGGAVDIRIAKNGRKIPMRSKKLTYAENSLPVQPKLPKHLQKNRNIMFRALRRAGFSQAPHEYWHWSYGDLWWAKRNNKKQTIYGPIDKE